MDTPGGWGLFAGWLLKSSAQAALLVVLVLAVQWLLRRRLTPQWRYFLWWLVVARLLMPVTLPGPVSIFNWVRWQAQAAPAVTVAPTAVDDSEITPLPDSIATAVEGTIPELPRQAPVTMTTPAPAAPPRQDFNWRLGVMWLWLVGAALLGARLGWVVLRLRRELKTATPVDDPTVLALLDECREQMGVRDRLTLLETPLVNSPALCGFWRPRLLLPPGLCRDFTAQQLRFIFLHELAHVRRHDIVVNWLITFLQLLHWFNPFVWLAFSRLRADRELACDALALSMAAPGEQHAYGQTIIRLLEGLARPSAMPGLVGILEDKNQMKRRIRMIAQFRRPGRWAWLSGIAAAILGIACLTDAQVPETRKAATAIGRPSSGPPAANSPTNASAPKGPTTSSAGLRISDKITPEKRAILDRLNRIGLPRIQFNNLPLKEVARELTDLAYWNDPSHRGINFFLSDIRAVTTPLLIDATTGLPIQAMPLSEVPVTIPAMNGPSLTEALEAVVNGAVFPIRYLVEGRGVVFSCWTNSTEPLWTGTFKVDPNLALPNAARWLGDAALNMRTQELVPSAIRQFLSNSQVDLAPPASIAWEAAAGVVIVRAPQTAFAAIETATQMLNQKPPQLMIEVKICEVAFQDDDLPELGRILGGSLERFSSAKSESRLTNAVEAAPPQVMTEARHNEVMRLLKQRSDLDFITALRVTTMSGRPARINIGTNTDAITGQTNLTTGVSVEATVFPDGTTIKVQAAAMIKTFVGYDTSQVHRRQYDYVAPPGIDPARMHETLPSAIPERPTGSNVPRAPIRNQEPIPVFRLRQTVANATVWDGQAMVLSRMTIGAPMGSRTGAPATNSLSLVGRLFRSESFGPRNSLVLIFVTPTIIDPAGNRVHSEKDLPFAQTNVPPQRGIR